MVNPNHMEVTVVPSSNDGGESVVSVMDRSPYPLPPPSDFSGYSIFLVKFFVNFRYLRVTCLMRDLRFVGSSLSEGDGFSESKNPQRKSIRRNLIHKCRVC